MVRSIAIVLLVLIAANAHSLNRLGLTANWLCSLDGVTMIWVNGQGDGFPDADLNVTCECEAPRDSLDGVPVQLGQAVIAANPHITDRGFPFQLPAKWRLFYSRAPPKMS